MNAIVSNFDKKALSLIRSSVKKLIEESAMEYDNQACLVLDVAPQIYAGCSEFYKNATVETLDLDPESGATYIADLCNRNSDIIPDNKFDAIVCTEVIEHVSNPFSVAEELYRIVKPGGKIYISTPLNFRIHGPLPDNWRFTIHGLKTLFSKFKIIKVEEVDTDNRDLMPIHYRLIAKK
jgi:SAM-dependent methyltransferase